MRKLEVADLYCGAGGASSGLVRACKKAGIPLELLAVNHWQIAIDTHSTNHPNARHLCQSVDNVNPREVVPSGRLHLLIAGPECIYHSIARGGRPTNDQERASAWHILRWAEALYIDSILIENVREFRCFPAETTVLSKRGIVPIGEVQVGDEVWTHNARWKPVTAVFHRTASTVRLRGYGNSIIESTPDHAFYARQYASKITQSGKYGRHEARLLEPEWIEAQNLPEKNRETQYSEKYSGYAWATPSELPRYWMRLPTTLNVDTNSPAFFYMIGRWLGDGWIRKREQRQNLVRICAHTLEANELECRLSETGLAWNRSKHSEGIEVFDLCAESSKVLVRWITDNFGEYAHRKTLPSWIFGAREEQRWSLLEGYCDADGHDRGNGEFSITSVSRCLAVGIKLLLQSLGVVGSISKTEAHEQPSIAEPEEQMECREAYQVCWKKETGWEKCFRSELHIWGRVRSAEVARENIEVIDISIQDDHSFVADGQVVHNCWGPVGTNGRPIKKLRGHTYHAFLNALRSLGYDVEDRILCAADYGDPTTRQRLFIMARRGRKKIHWPEPTHFPNRGGLFGKKPWRAAREIIDWSLPGKSIFSRKRVLAASTIERIIAGLRRFGGPQLEPFLIVLRNHSAGRSLDEPLPTLTAGGTHMALCEPFLLGQQSGSAPRRVSNPVPTIATGGAISLVEPFLVTVNHGEEGPDSHRCRTHSLNDPVPALTTKNGLAFIVPFFGERDGQKPRAHSVDEPLPTVTSHGAGALVQADPQPFVTKYYGTQKDIAHSVDKPLDTVTTKDRFGLVVPEVNGRRMDIRFRMLQPHELAAAQGFENYKFAGNKAEVTKQIGNAWPVNLAEALCSVLVEDYADRLARPRGKVTAMWRTA